MSKFREKYRSLLIRTLVGILILALVIPGYLIGDGLILRLILAIAAIIAVIELRCLVNSDQSRYFRYGLGAEVAVSVAAAIFGVILLSGIALSFLHPKSYLGLALVVTIATDVGAYLVGTLIGGKLIFNRPFPVISPKKSWEGLIGGLICGLVACDFWYAYVVKGIPTSSEAFVYILLPVIAIFGDLVESALKRFYDVKDSNDRMLAFFTPVEKLLGGRDGHGGYLDRLDSIAFTLCAVMLVAPL